MGIVVAAEVHRVCLPPATTTFQKLKHRSRRSSSPTILSTDSRTRVGARNCFLLFTSSSASNSAGYQLCKACQFATNNRSIFELCTTVDLFSTGKFKTLGSGAGVDSVSGDGHNAWRGRFVH